MIKSYLKSILEIYKRGDAREESYYSALKIFLEELVESEKNKEQHKSIAYDESNTVIFHLNK